MQTSQIHCLVIFGASVAVLFAIQTQALSDKLPENSNSAQVFQIKKCEQRAKKLLEEHKWGKGGSETWTRI